MTTITADPVRSRLPDGHPMTPARPFLAAIAITVFLAVFGAMLGNLPATSMPSVAIVQLGVAAELLDSAAHGESTDERRELVHCYRHAYRQHLDPSMCISAAP